VKLRVLSFPNIASAQTAFGLWFPFANGNAALLQLAPGKYATSFVPKPAKIISGLCYGTNCQVGFVWKVNTPYQLALTLTSKSGATETWTGSVSQGKNKPRSIFSFAVPASWGLISPTQKNAIISLVVDYNTVSSCDVVPYAQVLIENPIATSSRGSLTTAKPTGTFGGPCKTNSYVGGTPTSTSAKIAIGTQWIPGATPQPSPVPNPGKPLFTPMPMPTGSPQHLSDPITVGPLQPVLTNEFAYGLIGGPDEALTSLRFSDGSTRVWMDSGELPEGCSFVMSTKDFGSFEFLPKPEPNAVPVFDPTAPDTDAYDADYAGPNSVVPAANGRDLLMIYDSENHKFDSGWGIGYYATEGIARSSDAGLTWQREGAIITSESVKPPSPPKYGAGAGSASVVSVGGYLYAVFVEQGPGPRGLGLARAPLSSDGAPGSWRKYYDGSFSSDAQNHGPYTELLNPYVSAYFPNVTFNTYLNSFVMLLTSGNPFGGKTNLVMLTSMDLIHWSSPRKLNPQWPANPGFGPWYVSLITPGTTSNEITGQTGYVYLSFAESGGQRGLYRSKFTIGP
jgi:hypothetical protein